MSLISIAKWDATLQVTSLNKLPSRTTMQSYALKAEQSKTEEGGLEVEFVLAGKPNRNVIDISLAKHNLIMYYQPPLTELFKQEDCEVWMPTYVKTKKGRESRRPENVVGSYAVYHDSKRGNEYKTGKLCHIYRPKLVDAGGAWAWADFNRDANNTGTLTITLPQDFLDAAKYPVTVDPTFGYTSVGGSDDNWPAWYLVGGYYANANAGTATDIQVYGAATSGTGNVGAAIYNGASDDVTSLVVAYDPVNVNSTPQWWTFNIADTPVGVQSYWLCAWSNLNNFSMYYDSSGTSFYSTYYEPFNWEEDDVIEDDFSTEKWSIYVNVTTGGGVTVPVMMHHYGTHINKKIRGG